MKLRTNLLALAVIGAGGAALGHPSRLSATMAPSPWQVDNYCCEARGMGGTAVKCCGPDWCAVTSRGCTTA